MKAVLRCLLFTSLAFSAAVHAQSPVVTSIVPDSGPDSGGTLVTINGTNLATTIVCILPCPPRVIFGDVAVDAREESDRRLTVVTPAHEPGTVDVTVLVPGRDPVVVRNGFTFQAAADAEYEKVLLPVWFRGIARGANGTQWTTDLWMRNNGTGPVRLAPWECPPGLVCPPVFPLTFDLMPGRTLRNPELLSAAGRSNPSQIVYVARTGSANVAMSLRVADLSRGTLNAGTDTPVIRESELLRGRAQLFNVPLDERNFRVLLRIYELAYVNADFVVRLYRHDDDAAPPVHTALLTASTPQYGAFRNEAAYAQLDLTGLVGTAPGRSEAVRVEVEPVTPGSRFWTFASVTNNETQLVTLVTPQ